MTQGRVRNNIQDVSQCFDAHSFTLYGDACIVEF